MDGEEDVETYMTLEHSFMGMRYYNLSLTPVKFDFVVNVCGLAEVEISEDSYESEVIAACKKIETWLDYFITDTIFVDATDETELERIDGLCVDNTVVHMPGPPFNDIILQTFHSKLNALSGDMLYIGKASLRSSDSKSRHYFSNPEQMFYLGGAEYIGEYPIHDDPWWDRYDVDTTDIDMPIESIDRPRARAKINSKKLLDRFVKDIRKGLGLPKIKENRAEVVSIEKANKWKPKIATTSTDG